MNRLNLTGIAVFNLWKVTGIKAMTKQRTDSIRTKVSPLNGLLYKITGGGLNRFKRDPNLDLCFYSGSKELVSCSVRIVIL